jgi:hypothetical protein
MTYFHTHYINQSSKESTMKDMKQINELNNHFQSIFNASQIASTNLCKKSLSHSILRLLLPSNFPSSQIFFKLFSTLSQSFLISG